MPRPSQNAPLLQTIDRVVGVPLCFAATLLLRLRRILSRSAPAGYPDSILFLKLAEQGSTVLAHEAFSRAVRRLGRENVYILLFEENRFVVDLLEVVPPENVLTIETRSAWTMVLSLCRRLRQIRRRRIGAVIDMEFFTRFPAVITWLTGAPIRVGFHGATGTAPYRGDLHTHRLLYNPHLHTHAMFVAMVMALDADALKFPALPVISSDPVPPPRFRYPEFEGNEVQQLMIKAGLRPTGRLVLLNANASDLLPLRRWDQSNYVALAHRLLDRYPELQIALTGAPEESDRVGQLCTTVGSPRCVSLAGRTTLRQLLIVYDLADVLVTNDSGPAHFASLTGIDCVTLFGPETPLLYSGIGPRQHPLSAGLVCSPCVNAFNNRQTSCRDNKCMQALTVDTVFAKVVEVFERRLRVQVR